MDGCDLCVLLVAFRRGHIPEGETQSSITQLEYRYAVEHGIDVIPFCLKEDAPWPRKFDEMDTDPAIRTWREELYERYGVGEFDFSPTSIEIEPAITRWITEHHRRGVSAQPVKEEKTLAIVPKGLRAFDAADSDFFLQLLPGSRDKDGLSTSIRFWKHRIESADATTFTVGLIWASPALCRSRAPRLLRAHDETEGVTHR